MGMSPMQIWQTRNIYLFIWDVVGSSWVIHKLKDNLCEVFVLLFHRFERFSYKVFTTNVARVR